MGRFGGTKNQGKKFVYVVNIFENNENIMTNRKEFIYNALRNHMPSPIT